MTTKHSKYKNQDGVTLLLSMFILSALTLVTLSVAAFAIQELRSSRALIASEPAIVAAETGAEHSLWQYKRNGTVPDCSSPSVVNLPSSRSAFEYCRSADGDTYQLVAGVPQKFSLYDPNDIENADLSGYNYEYLSVSNRTTSAAVEVRIMRIDGTPVGGQPVTVLSGSPVQIVIPTVATGTEGRMEVTLESSSAAIVDVTTNRGLPHIVSLDSSACSSKQTVPDCNSTSQELYNRKIKVKIE